LKPFGVSDAAAAMVGLLLAMSAAIGVAKLCSMTAATTVFLESWGAGSFPYTYAIASVLVPMAGVAFIRLERLTSLVNRLIAVLVLMTTAQVVVWLALTASGGKVSTMATLVWAEVEWALTKLIFYGVANRLFDVRQVKRLLAFTGVGEVAATITGGAVIPFALGWLGTADLLLFSAGAHVISISVLLAIVRAWPDRMGRQESAEEVAPKPASGAPRDRYAWHLSALVAIFYVAYYVVDNAFYERVEAQFSSAEEVASFVARFYAGFGLFNLLVKVFVSRPWLARFGLLGGLMSAPLFVGLGALGTMTAALSGATQAAFWLAVMTKLLERTSIDSLNRPSYYALFQTLPASARLRTQTVADLIVSPMAGGVAGLLLLVLNKVIGVGIVGLSLTAAIICVVWLLEVFAAGRAYRRSLAVALKRRGLSGADELTFREPETRVLLARALKSSRRQEVLYALGLLARFGPCGLNTEVVELLDHGDARVRAAACKAIESGHAGDIDEVIDRLTDEPDTSVRVAMFNAVAATRKEDAYELLAFHLDDSDEALRVGAMIAMLRHGGLEGGVTAGSVLLKDAASPEAASRIRAARVLGGVGQSSFSRPLAPLLDDPDPEVQRAAIDAAGHVDSARLWPTVLRALDEPALRSAALTALDRASEVVLPAMAQAFQEATTPPARQRLARAVGRIGGRGGIELLTTALRSRDGNLRTDALRSLRRCGFSLMVRGDERLDALLATEIDDAEQLLVALCDIDEDNDSPARRVLVEELDKVRERVFRLLAFRYDGEAIMDVWESLRSAATEYYGLATELLEQAVPPRHRALVMPLIETLTPQQRLAKLAPGVTFSPIGAAARLVELAQDADKWTSEWLRLCAAQAAGRGAGRRTIVHTVELLRQAEIFADLPSEVLRLVAQCVVDVRVEAGQCIIEEGRTDRRMYVIAEGSARVHRGDTELAVIGSGDIVGELAALRQAPRTASVTMLEDGHLFALTADVLYEMTIDRIEIARGIMGVLCRRLRASMSPVAGQDEVAPEEVVGADDGELPQLERMMVLKSTSLFDRTSDSVLYEVAERAREVWLQAGETLFKGGELGRTMYIVVSGGLRVHQTGGTVAQLGPRAVCGELAVLSPGSRSADVSARVRTRLLSLDQRAVYALMESSAEFVSAVVEVLADRLAAASRAR